jgi:riboflavin synthase
MFTGIVTDIGIVRRVEKRGDTRFVIETNDPTAGIAIGASIACSGCCLTVNVTTLKDWTEGTRINLERALKLGDELGGHVVSGHVDGIATVASITPEGDSRRFVFEAPQSLARFVAPKGSVTLDGTSLTVNEVDGTRFGINIIPHTQKVTTWGAAKASQCVNIEIDMLARYVARLTEFQTS